MRRKKTTVLFAITAAACLLLNSCTDSLSDFMDAANAFAENDVPEINPSIDGNPIPNTPVILDPSPDTALYNPDDTWAIYWYLCGSDLETAGGFASGDLAEMLRVTLPENVTVVIETGGASVWQDYVDPGVNSRLVYSGSDLYLMETVPSANMGDPNTLASFLSYCNTNFPADHQAVVFWNHGGGSVSGVAFDEIYGMDALTLPEIRAAFNAVNTHSEENPPYELIGFDACLMATIDTAETLGGFARYMVASEESEPACGWDYAGWLGALAADTGMNGAELGKVICDTYYAGCEAINRAETATLSVTDITRIGALLSAYYDVGAESLLNACIDPTYFIEFGRAARSAENYGGNNQTDGYTNMVDLGDLVRQTNSESGGRLLAALDECVVYRVNGPYRARSSGLSCYYNYSGDYNSLATYASFRENDPFEWFHDYSLRGELSAEGVQYVMGLLGQYPQQRDVALDNTVPTPEYDGLQDYPVILGGDGYAVLSLGSEIADKLTGVYCNLAYYDIANDLSIYLGRDNDINSDWVNGVFADNFRGVWGSIDGVLVYMEVFHVGDGYQLYTVPILLNGEEYSLMVCYTFADGAYEMLGARRGIGDNGMADKNLRLLLPGDVVEPIHYMIFDTAAGNTDFTVMPVESLTVTQNTQFFDADLGDGYFIFMFEMVDVQNNSYLSQPAVFSVDGGVITLLDQ